MKLIEHETINKKMAATFDKIALMDHMGYGNMGDAAIQESFISNIRKRLPAVELIAFSLNPGDTEQRHGLQAYPIRWSHPGYKAMAVKGESSESRDSKLKKFLKNRRFLYPVLKAGHDCWREVAHLRRSFRILKGVDALVIAGGGQLCELWSDLPYNVFKFCVLAKLAGKRIMIVGVGADLLERRENKFFARWSVRLASRVSLRSAESRERLRAIGVRKEMMVCPDPAYGLDLETYVKSRTPGLLERSDWKMLPVRGNAPKKVGINPMGFCDPRRWMRGNDTAYLQYLEKLETVITWLLGSSYEVEVFTSDMSGDISAIQDLKQRLNDRLSTEALNRVAFRPQPTLEEVLQQMASYEYVITSKFHGVIFAHMLGKPVIALSYLPKIDHLMQAVGHERYCLDIEQFDAEWLIGTFRSMVKEQEQLRARFEKTSDRYNGAIQAHFDELFGTVVRQQAPLAIAQSKATVLGAGEQRQLASIGREL